MSEFETLLAERDELLARQARMEQAHDQTRHALLGEISRVAIERDALKSNLIGALWDYHHALDTRKDRRIAGYALIEAVEAALGKPWKRGATLAKETP